ncbi:hypothetical protein EXIGLDRAFT_694184 [Exidia glandulosa HHB12029]|uniref:CBM1 domain-containing protein n=1 Tax=Exidia glandulosa HHB12029 TaxID=1314781 RepID=A0A165GRL2_EXIGL|nr:hypothetical protein EXIGLDRAFT_694184 [Exidia glandulosa HHB12029]
MSPMQSHALYILTLLSCALAVPLWGQCGGKQYDGDRACDPDGECAPLNMYYWQCIPAQPYSAWSPAFSNALGIGHGSASERVADSSETFCYQPVPGPDLATLLPVQTLLAS